MQGPAVKLLPRGAGVLESASDKVLESLAVVGHVKEENPKGWIIAECGTFVPKSSYEEVAREWDPQENED